MRLQPIARQFLSIAVSVLMAGSLIESHGVVADERISTTPESLLPDCFIVVSKRVVSGAQPEHEDHYASLAAFGVRTIVSVDGAIPDVAMAKKFGLRYVHIPIGYDGVPIRASIDLAEVVRQTQGSVFVHCHHGRHRGPAAAAIAAMANGEIDKAKANAVLEEARTGRQYQGLWRDVANFKRSWNKASTSSLVEKAEVGLLARSMSQLSRSMESFDESLGHRQNAHESSNEMPPSQIAVLIEEGFRESMRAPELITNTEMARQMSDATKLAHEFRIALDRDDWTVANRKLRDLKQTCASCHRAHRN